MPSPVVIAQSIAKVLAPTCFQNEAGFAPMCFQNTLELEDAFLNTLQNMLQDRVENTLQSITHSYISNY